MNINYKQPQFELFPANSATLDDVNKPRLLLANLSIPIESLVILTILGIMMALFAFSIGVERGKHLAAQSMDERVAAAWNLAPRKPAMPIKPVMQKVAVRQAALVLPVASKVKGSLPVVTKTALVKSAPLAASRFMVQISSNRNKASAAQEALGLKAKGLNSFLIQKGDFWLVCLGPFPSQQSAGEAIKKAPSKYRALIARRF